MRHWKFGRGKVLRIDAETYSIVMAVVQFKAGVICLPACEMEIP